MSQDYTPVSWVDETTSQQGTLINAERLNQMQTAHHYADGFEEVDAIPTEDPGVDYHKVVYCTADATFYRWDGEVWTADIDEETKHLLDQEIARAEHAEGLIQGYLDAHEANHANPHQVTKAQVGLGNCDNTADLDKPISTAAQAALDTKADKATTLAGYGITDAYTKTEADTLLADKADKADVYDKTAADTLLAGKVDKLVSSPAGTYKSVTVNAQGQVTAGTNPDTLAGFGITDAYTKTEADNLLASKADTTALTDGSVTKVGTADVGTDTKPIKLVAGVPTEVGHDLMTTDTTQDINAVKSSTMSGASSANNGKDVPPRFNAKSTGFDRTANQGINRHYPIAGLVDKNDLPASKIAVVTTDSSINTYLQAVGKDGTAATMMLGKFDRTTHAWTTEVPTPASGAGANEVATVGYVSDTNGLNNLVHTNGAETIPGVKTFTDWQNANTVPYTSQRVTATNKWFKVFTITNDARAVLKLTVTWAHQSYNGFGYGECILAAIGGSTTAKWVIKAGNASAFTDDTVFIGTRSGAVDIWIKAGYYVYASIDLAYKGNVIEPLASITNVYDGTPYDLVPESDYTNFAYGSSA